MFSVGGCNPSASYSKMIEDDLWLCAFDNTDGGTWVQAYTACNQGGDFHLATVSSMTPRGAPSDSNISNAITWARARSFRYALTGQPTRNARWDDNNNDTCVSGMGLIPVYSTSEEASSGSNWMALLDGNDSERRDWPNAICPTYNGLPLISLCQDASSIPNACVFDHRWRVGNFADCISPGESGTI